MVRYNLAFIAPIPVGHSVELTFYKKKHLKLFGGVEYQAMPDLPVVRDLDTGVVYGATHMFTENEYRPLQGGMEVGDHPREQFEESSKVVGRVLHCQVLSCQPTLQSSVSMTHVQTTLVIEPDEETGAYR